MVVQARELVTMRMDAQVQPQATKTTLTQLTLAELLQPQTMVVRVRELVTMQTLAQAQPQAAKTILVQLTLLKHL